MYDFHMNIAAVPVPVPVPVTFHFVAYLVAAEHMVRIVGEKARARIA